MTIRNMLDTKQDIRFPLVLCNLWMLVLCALVTVSLTSRLEAFEFKDYLRSGEILKYKHWNTEKRIVTGFSVVDYRPITKEGKAYILETNRNTNESGSVYSVKTTRFFADTGILDRYEEIDYRSNLRIVDQYHATTVETHITDGISSDQFSLELKPALVPLEILVFWLKREIPRLMRGTQVPFDLYFPLIAFELEKKKLPLSLSSLRMVATVEQIQRMQTILGDKKTVRVVVMPESALMVTLLPKGRAEFRFTFLAEAPFRLIMFEENQTQTILMEIN